MKLLLVHPYLEIFDRYVSQMKAISENIKEFHVAYCSGKIKEEWKKHFVFHKFMNFKFNPQRVGFQKKLFRAPMYAKRLFHANIRIKEYLRDLDVDLTYVLSSYWQQRLAVAYSQKNNIPCVARVRGHFQTELYMKHSFFPRMFYVSSIKRSFKKTALVIPITNRIRNDLKYFGIQNLSKPVGLGVDCKLFKPKTKLTSGFIVGFVGRLSEEKGIKHLINIARFMKNTQFYVAGRKQTEIKFPKNIKYFGRIPHKEMPDFYRNVNVVFMPSLTEGFPNVILESYACGRPVIVSNLAIPRELKLFGFKGEMIKLPLIIKSAENAGLGILGKCARDYVKRNYTWERFGERMLECMKPLI